MKDPIDKSRKLDATATDELLRERQQHPLTEMERQATSRSVQQRSEHILALTNPDSNHQTVEALSDSIRTSVSTSAGSSGSNDSGYSSVQLDGTVIRQRISPVAGRDDGSIHSNNSNNNSNRSSSFRSSLVSRASSTSGQGNHHALGRGRRHYEERLQAKKEAFDTAANDSKPSAVGATYVSPDAAGVDGASSVHMPSGEAATEDKASRESMASLTAKVERYANEEHGNTTTNATAGIDKADDASKIKDDASSSMRKGSHAVPTTSSATENASTSYLRDSDGEGGDDDNLITPVDATEPKLLSHVEPSSNPADVNLSVAHAITAEDLEAQIRSTIISGAVQATCVTASPEDSPEAVDGDSDSSKRSNAANDGDGDGDASKKRRLILMMLAVGCCVVIVIVAVLLSKTGEGNSSGNAAAVDDQVDNTQPPVALEMASPTAAPTVFALQPFHFDFLDWLKQNAVNPEPLTLVLDGSTTEETPQYQAFAWLASDSIKSADDIPAPNSAEASLVLERYALACVYYSTFGHEWTVTNEWLTQLPVCEWYGITCDPVLGKVVNLDLEDNNVRGSLPADIGHFEELQNLEFGKNPFSTSRSNFGKPPKRALGTIDGSLQPGLPTTIGFLTNLEYISMRRSGLGGRLPTEFGFLIKLKKILVKDSYLVGPLPSELGNMQELRELSATNNAFTGTLPSELGNLSKLDSINIEESKLVGTIPIEYTGWTSPMGHVRFADNLFDPDTIEATFCNITLGFSAGIISFSCPVSTCSCCTVCD